MCHVLHAHPGHIRKHCHRLLVSFVNQAMNNRWRDKPLVLPAIVEVIPVQIPLPIVLHVLLILINRIKVSPCVYHVLSIIIRIQQDLLRVNTMPLLIPLVQYQYVKVVNTIILV